MQIESLVDSSQSVGESYTCVSFETLQLRIPGVEPESDDVFRDYPAEPLIERDLNDIEMLRIHPFFNV